VSGALRSRELGRKDRTGAAPGAIPAGKDRGGKDRGRAAPAVVDDDMAEIEALLRKRGIS